jgi:hypothetical protein
LEHHRLCYGPAGRAGGNTFTLVATPPTGDGLVVDTVHLGIFSFGSGVNLYLDVQDATYCGPDNGFVGSYYQYVATTGAGDIDVPLSPVLVVPAGDDLRLYASGSINLTASASGYTIPGADAPSQAIRTAPAPRANP